MNQYIYLNYYFQCFVGCVWGMEKHRGFDTVADENTAVTRRQYLEQSKIVQGISRNGKIIISWSIYWIDGWATGQDFASCERRR